MAFSTDGRYLLTQCNNAFWTLYLWTWEKGKPISQMEVMPMAEKEKIAKSASLLALNETQTMVTHVSFNPKDESLICISGARLFKVLRLTDGNFKPINSARLDAKVLIRLIINSD